MFREIECCMRSSNPKSQTRGYENDDYLRIESYGISVTTLEEVFLRVAGGDFDDADGLEEKNPPVLPDSSGSGSCQNYTSKKIFQSKTCRNLLISAGFLVTIIGRAFGIFFGTFVSLFRFLSIQCCCCILLSKSTFWRHFKALLRKRAITAQRDRKTLVFQLLIPAVFLFIGLLFLKLKPHPEQQSITLTTSHFNPLLSGGGGGGPIPFDLSWPISEEV